MTEHPVTPPPVLVAILASGAEASEMTEQAYIATQAARWGADQELEACCEWADATGWEGAGDSLRAARRPKPPSLKEQALAAVAELEGFKGVDTIRRALEALDD